MAQFAFRYFAGVTALFCATLLYATTPVPDLSAAVKAGDAAAVHALLNRRADVNARERDGTTALHWAVRANNQEFSELLVRAGADVNAINRYGITPLSLAAAQGNAPILSILLKAGANLKSAEASLPDGETLVMLAARTDSVEAVQALAAGGLDVNAAEPRTGTTALMWAALENRPFVIKALLKTGAKINTRSLLPNFPHTPPAVVGDALEEGMSYIGQSALPKGGWTALMYAAREGSLDAAAALADSGADLNVTDPDGTSALEYAIINAHYPLAKMLIDKGADPNLADRMGMTPLYAAVDMHTLASTFGRPELPHAVREESVGMVEYLLAHKADPNSRLKGRVLKRVYNPGDNRLGEGATPLMRAARGGDAQLMRILLTAGADPMLNQKNGRNPIILAAGLHPSPGGINPLSGTEASVIEAMTICLDHGIDINATNDADETAVFAAIGAPATIRFLVEHGARLDVKNKKGQTPLEAALQGREPGDESVAVLRQLAGATARGR
jgi:ankyrin repeat protein